MSCCCGCKCGAPSNADANDVHLIEIVQKAIEQENAAKNTTLAFGKILTVTKQIVSGLKLIGTVEVTNAGATEVYNFDIWAKPGNQEIVVNKLEKQ